MSWEPTMEVLRTMQVPPESLIVPPTHRRTVWRDMDALTASVRRSGVIVPLVVREVVDHLEFRDDGAVTQLHVMQGARRQRAAIAAKLPWVPVLVVAVDDKTAIEMQYVENHDRDSLHPLDEGDLFADLLNAGYDVKGIAKRFGVPKAIVASRLQLRRLTLEVRAAYAAGEVDDESADAIACFPLEDQQTGVLEAIRNGAIEGADAITGWARRHLMAPLTGVPWELGDATMPGGACARCPTRSGAQREIFESIAGSEDLCLNVACRAAKMATAYDRALAEVSRRPGERAIVEDVAPEDLFVPRAGGELAVVRSSGYIDAQAECPTGRTWYAAAIAAGAKPILYLARDQDGRPRQLIREREVPDLRRSVREAAIAQDPEASAASAEKELGRIRAAKRRETTAELVRLLTRKMTLEMRTTVLAQAVEAFEAHIASTSSARVVREVIAEHGDDENAARPFPCESYEASLDYLIAIFAALVVAELGAARPPLPAIARLAVLCGVELT